MLLIIVGSLFVLAARATPPVDPVPAGQCRQGGETEGECEWGRGPSLAGVGAGLLGEEASSVSQGRCDELIQTISGRNLEELEALGFEPLSVGFANVVCGKSEGSPPRELIVKLYTGLVLLRLKPEAIGVVDVYAGELGVGPRVLRSTRVGKVEERIPGRTLSEADMHKGDLPLMGQVAKSVARYHALPVPPSIGAEPMLWVTVDRMMESILRLVELPPGLPSPKALMVEVDDAKVALARHSTKLVLGHGDLKPSNAVLGDGVVTLIDFELGGPNYRGFDLMKLFRTELQPSGASLAHFYSIYAQEAGGGATGAELAAEARVFLPLTWLEAAIFFLALPPFKPDETLRWNQLAAERWRKYMDTKHLLFLSE